MNPESTAAPARQEPERQAPDRQGPDRQAPDRQALIERLLNRKGIRRARTTRIPRRATFSPCELSFAQEGLWLAGQLHAQGAAYHIPTRLRVGGPLDVAAIRAGLAAVVSRHEALRTSITVIDGEPWQHVHASVRTDVPLIDLHALPPDERERAAVRVARVDARRSIALDRAPLLRALVVRLAAEDHVLLFTLHHLVADGWSMSILVRELSTFYRGLISGQPVTLPAPEVQYADFAVWQRAQAGGDAFDRMLAHWTGRLADLPPTELPGVPVAPAQRTGLGASESLPSPQGLLPAVQTIARRTGATAFVTWVAAMAVWLHRYTGQRDIAIGMPAANRLQADLEDAIGCFVNLLVLRIPIHGGLSFDEVVGRVREISLDAFAHQDVPFERIFERVGTPREAGSRPLFRVVCVFHNVPPGRLDLPGLRVAPFGAGSGPARFDLELDVWQSDDRVGGSLLYASDLFPSGAASRMLEHLTTVMLQGSEHPLRPIASLSLLSGAEQSQIRSWNAAHRAWDARTVVDLIDAQSDRTPHAPAVVAGAQTWDYATLRQHAGDVARALRLRGIGRASRVGLYAGRSPETIAAVIAVLNTGAAYVPLDVSSPPHRLRTQVLDAKVDLLLADRDASAFAPSTLPVLPIAETQVRAKARAASIRAEAHGPTGETTAVDPEDLAYVLYTSGSTGVPKGVMVTHRGLANYVRWARETYPLGPGDVTLFHSPLAYDLSVTSVLAPLVCGGTVLIVPETSANGIDDLVRAFRTSENLGFIKLTPSHLRALADLHDPSALAGRTRSFVVGGEALDAALVERWLAAAPGIRLFNEYGPTETVVGSCVQEIRAGETWTDPVPIGSPIANTTLYVTTPHWQLAPLDAAGDLWIGGAGVARGYLDRPDLTAERFVPDDFGVVPGARLYRTGDRARRREDGTLEYLGRRDDQIKIRGHRVELGEIEAVLREQPQIRDVAVIVRTDGQDDRPGDGTLIAYIVPNTDSPSSDASVQEWLRERLPEHMRPSAIITLPALPLTTNGKVDRRRLPAPAVAGAAVDTVRPPRTPIEELLAAIWADVLGVEQFGVHDNFFALHGHSLLATRVLSRVREVFGIDLPLRAMFDGPTIADLAARVTEAMASEDGVQRPPIVAGTRGGPSPLSFAQQRLWFMQQLDPESGFLNIPFALRLHGPLTIPALRDSIAALLERHEILRTTFAFEGRALAQRVQPMPVPVLPTVSLEHLPEPARAPAARRLVDMEARRPADLARGPVFRTLLVRLAPEDHVLVCVIHHIATDAWSTAIVIRDVSAYYRAAIAGRPSPLPPPALQYADFAMWQRAWLSPDVLERQLDYWRRQLADVNHDEPLFPARTSPSGPSRRRGLESIVAGAKLTQDLRDLSRQHDVTLFMTLFAALEIVLHAETGRSVFVIGTDVAGRRDARVEPLVGLFVNQLVLRADLRDDISFAELLADVRATVLGADEHQDLPFERLVQALQPRRAVGQHPIFQASVVYDNTPTAALDMPDLAVEPFGLTISETQSDFNIVLSDRSEGVVGRVEYDADLFDDEAAPALVRAFLQVLGDARRNPDVRVSTLVERVRADRVDRSADRSPDRSPDRAKAPQ